MKALQKVLRHGHSAVVTIPRPLLFKCDLLFGDFVALHDNPDGTITLTKWHRGDDVSRQSPGVIDSTPSGERP